MKIRHGAPTGCLCSLELIPRFFQRHAACVASSEAHAERAAVARKNGGDMPFRHLWGLLCICCGAACTIDDRNAAIIIAFSRVARKDYNEAAVFLDS